MFYSFPSTSCYASEFHTAWRVKAWCLWCPASRNSIERMRENMFLEKGYDCDKLICVHRSTCTAHPWKQRKILYIIPFTFKVICKTYINSKKAWAVKLPTQKACYLSKSLATRDFRRHVYYSMVLCFWNVVHNGNRWLQSVPIGHFWYTVYMMTLHHVLFIEFIHDTWILCNHHYQQGDPEKTDSDAKDAVPVPCLRDAKECRRLCSPAHQPDCFTVGHLLSRLKLASAGTHIAKDKDHMIVTNNRSKMEQAIGANEKLAKWTFVWWVTGENRAWLSLRQSRIWSCKHSK